MATGNIGKKLQSEITCFVCSEYLIQPVTLDCGHNFCHACIVKCWAQISDRTTCPQCRVVVPRLNFKPNRQLANAIQLIRQLSDQAEGNSKCCQQHQEHLELFCKNNQVFVCSVCRGSEEHKGHTVIPIETAALEFKVGIFYLLYYREKGTADKMEADWKEGPFIVEAEAHGLFWPVDHMELKVSSFYTFSWVLHLSFLFLCKNMYSIGCSETPMEPSQKKEEHINQVSKEPPGLSSGDEICSPLVFCSCFFFSFFPFVAQVTLDPDTAHPKLIISENRKSLILGNWPRLHSHYSKRFDQYLFMLGCENFNTGRCYWEATVGSEDGWGLGVAKASVKCEGIVSLDPREGIWAMAKRGDHCTVLLPPDFPTLLMKWDLQRIRVSLNYIGDRLSFFDADRGILLVVFSGASFSEEPLHPFFWLQRKCQLILSDCRAEPNST
uniref:Uncharacterized protein n=1 Tax=Naja naja TaxID=35670 RepID=A0A8C6VHX8_NAJNA